MKLDRTKELIHGTINESEPLDALVHVLESALELVQLPDNDFSWSCWRDSYEAAEIITTLLNTARSEELPERADVCMLFAPTGPLQEVSLSSGWADAFIKVSDKYDQVEKLLWSNS